ncbi:MAG: PilW family protein [Halioglobus sp.]
MRLYSIKQLGLSLVEQMVALALGIIVVAGITQLYVDISRSNEEMAKTNSQVENARFAMQFLRTDLAHSGYWGRYVPEFDDISLTTVPIDVPTVIPRPCLAYASWGTPAANGGVTLQQYLNSVTGIPLEVYDDVPAACDALLPAQQPNTDVVIVRHASKCLPGATNCEADIAGKLYFKSSNCELQRAVGINFALDPNSSSVMYQRDCIGVAGSPPTISSGTAELKRKFNQHIYYVRTYAITPGDGIPTLMRSEFDLSGGSVVQVAAVPLVEGIERFRVELGLDLLGDGQFETPPVPINYSQGVNWKVPLNRADPLNRGDGLPESPYVHCGSACTLSQLINAVVVKVHLIARAGEPSPGYNDSKTYRMGLATGITFTDKTYKRHAFSSTVRIGNNSARRETP